MPPTAPRAGRRYAGRSDAAHWLTRRFTHGDRATLGCQEPRGSLSDQPVCPRRRRDPPPRPGVAGGPRAYWPKGVLTVAVEVEHGSCSCPGVPGGSGRGAGRADRVGPAVRLPDHLRGDGGAEPDRRVAGPPRGDGRPPPDADRPRRGAHADRGGGRRGDDPAGRRPAADPWVPKRRGRRAVPASAGARRAAPLAAGGGGGAAAWRPAPRPGTGRVGGRPVADDRSARRRRLGGLGHPGTTRGRAAPALPPARIELSPGLPRPLCRPALQRAEALLDRAVGPAGVT